MSEETKIIVGSDAVDDGFKPVVMLKLRSGAVRYLVLKEYADDFARDVERASKLFDTRVDQEGSQISIEEAAVKRATVYFYLGKDAAIEGKTIEGEIGHVYRAVFHRNHRYEIEFYEYPYAFSNGKWGMVGRPLIDLSKIRLYTTAANAIIELLHS
jgi:hypothetical protein